jgi:hypothetical protein
MKHKPPTPYPEVNAVLDELCTRARAVLGDQFVGLTLYGSLASGDFDPATSDVDFVVVTTGELPARSIAAVADLHAAMLAAGGPWAMKLEGAYVPLRGLRRHDPAAPPCPCVNEGRFQVAQLGSDWVIQRHLLREHGVTVAGPDLKDFIDPVAPDDLRWAVASELRDWWAPMLDQPDPRLPSREYQVYAVLTMCRALHTLHHGSIASKPVAARWAQATLDRRWAALIERALAESHGTRREDLAETLAFIRYAVERGQYVEEDSRADSGAK